MADIPSVLTVDEYLHMRNNKKTQLQSQTQHLFLEKAKFLLLSQPELVKPKFKDVAANDIIVKGKRIFEHVEQCDTKTDPEKAKKKGTLYRLSDRFRSMQDEAILVIQSDGARNMVEECDGQITNHLQNFAYAFPSIINHSGESMVTYAEVKCHEDLKKSLEDFFQTSAARAKTSVVAFNGDVDKKTFKLSKDCSIKLPAFIGEIRDAFHDGFGRFLLPLNVDVAFNELDAEVRNSVTVLSLTYSTELYLASKRMQILLPEEKAPQTIQATESQFVQSAGRSSGLFGSQSQKQSEETTQCLHVSPSSWSIEEAGYDEVDAL